MGTVGAMPVLAVMIFQSIGSSRRDLRIIVRIVRYDATFWETNKPKLSPPHSKTLILDYLKIHPYNNESSLLELIPRKTLVWATFSSIIVRIVRYDATFWGNKQTKTRPPHSKTVILDFLKIQPYNNASSLLGLIPRNSPVRATFLSRV